LPNFLIGIEPLVCIRGYDAEERQPFASASRFKPTGCSMLNNGEIKLTFVHPATKVDRIAIRSTSGNVFGCPATLFLEGDSRTMIVIRFLAAASVQISAPFSAARG